MADGSSVESTIRMEYGDEAEYVPHLIETDIDSHAAEDTKYAVKRVETSYSQMSKKRKLAYQMSGIAMGLMPVLYALTSVLICGFLFYQKKLEEPIETLLTATKEISKNNLDFTLDYTSKDELGQLCISFEKMRSEIYDNNRKIWSMLEERKLMQNSLAHDLRNPIAIIEGYTEYFMLNISKQYIDKERLLKIARNLNIAAKRLETYTDSIRKISRLEEMEIKPVDVDVQTLLDELELDFRMMVAKHNVNITIESSVDIVKVKIDTQVLYRILENILNNALRFAKEEVRVLMNYAKGMLTVAIEDDGVGFSPEVLTGKGVFPYTSDKTGQHQGIGLVVSRILCQKHGGQLQLKNKAAGGAYVEIILHV